MSLSLNKSLAANYAGYYDVDDNIDEWRNLGALDKCANIVSLCSELPHKSILEIGCGEGAILARLSSLGFGSHFNALEISPSAIRKVHGKSLPNVNVQLFNGYDIPFDAALFDLVIMSHVLEHVEYPRKLILEAARIAKHVFVEVPLEDNRTLPDNFVFDRVGHINSYRQKTIRHLVQSCQMNIISARMSNPSVRSYVYRKGRLAGGVTFLIKELGRRCSPSFASHLFTYNYSLIYKRDHLAVSRD
jgi:SAM-dependent methyltransferase